ncbi:MAG: hypothetical protein ACXVXN_00535 [Mycobacteriaceae bacterium]
MKDQRLSAAALHRLSGVSENTIGNVLRGVGASDGTLRKLRQALGILPQTTAQQQSLSEVYPPNVVAVQLMVGALMLATPESEWEAIGREVAATLLAHQSRVSGGDR